MIFRPYYYSPRGFTYSEYLATKQSWWFRPHSSRYSVAEHANFLFLHIVFMYVSPNVFWTQPTRKFLRSKFIDSIRSLYRKIESFQIEEKGIGRDHPHKERLGLDDDAFERLLSEGWCAMPQQKKCLTVFRKQILQYLL